ncbi:transferrin receptor 1-like protein [Labeo rohita]|uniref:Transferrin receptor protein 1 n=1 Tax=Labeo rohita TaxID=84645 RepID=A0A498NVI8_LABRO|nr:transferrin receptor 1-like protein [Labeo rohita]
MDQARTTISKIFNGEPRSYTRFNLTQNMEGDNSQVEMKLSSDMDEEVEANGVGETINQHNRPYHPSKLNQRSPKTVCGFVIGILFLFIIGYLIGYLSNRSTEKTEIKPDCPVSNEFAPVVAEPVYSLDWSDLKALLKKKLTTANINSNLKEFSSTSHQAGSTGDEALANKIIGKFKTFGMSTWTDEHYVKIHEPSSSNNRVQFRGNDVGTTEGYLAYSAVKTVQGAARYAHYGRAEDFRRLQELNVDVNGRVVLVRAGLLSFAEKVANAGRLNASAVLIYPDPVNYSIRENTALFGHVHLGTGDPYTPGFPSFNHTQFPPAQSSGLPSIPAQTITIGQAAEIMRMETMFLSHSVYPFQTFSGIPSLSFRFTSTSESYPYGTIEDTEQNLERYTSYNTLKLAKTSGEVVGLVTLRLVHDHLLKMNVAKYTGVIRNYVSQIRSKVESRQMVEGSLLSPYVSPRQSLFRHILLGSGSHTLAALVDHLEAIKGGLESADIDQFKNQFALATWTIQGCANALAGEVWDMDNEI